MQPLKKVETQSYVLFELGPFRLGVDVVDVASIIELPRVSRLPMMPEYVTGSFMYQGRIASLVDLHIKFNVSPNSDKSAVLISRVGNNLLGFKVDQIHEMIQSHDIQSEKQLNIGMEMLAGVTEKWGVVFLSSFQALLDAEAKLFTRTEVNDYQQQYSVTEKQETEALHLVETDVQQERPDVDIENKTPDINTPEYEQDLYDYALELLEQEVTEPEVQTTVTDETEALPLEIAIESKLTTLPIATRIDNTIKLAEYSTQEPKRLTDKSPQSWKLQALTKPHTLVTSAITRKDLCITIQAIPATAPVLNEPQALLNAPEENKKLTYIESKSQDVFIDIEMEIEQTVTPFIGIADEPDTNAESVPDKPVINVTRPRSPIAEAEDQAPTRTYREQKLGKHQRNIFNKQRPVALPLTLVIACTAGGFYYWNNELNVVTPQTEQHELIQSGTTRGAIGQLPEVIADKLPAPAIQPPPFVPVTEIKGQNFSIQIERPTSNATTTTELNVIEVASKEPDAVREFKAFIHNKTEPVVPPVNVVHTVTQGESLWKIANQYLNNPYRYPELAELSNIVNPDLIYVGDRVIITSK